MLFYEATITRKNNIRLNYYVVRSFDGINLTVEKVKNPPCSLAFSLRKTISGYDTWYVHKLDDLKECFNIVIINETKGGIKK